MTIDKAKSVKCFHNKRFSVGKAVGGSIISGLTIGPMAGFLGKLGKKKNGHVWTAKKFIY